MPRSHSLYHTPMLLTIWDTIMALFLRGDRPNSAPEKSGGSCEMPIAPIQTGIGVACIEISILLCSTTCKSRAPLVRSPVRRIYSEMLLAHD